MYIVWRQRPITNNRRTEIFVPMDGKYRDHEPERGSAWKPLYCEHDGPNRIAWTPLLMHAERIDGKPRQKLVRRLPTIRSCCLKDPFIRAAWWHDVEERLDTLERWDDELARPLMARDKRSILISLRDRVPRPSKGGVDLFTAYRLDREAEWDARRKLWQEAASLRAAEPGYTFEDLVREKYFQQAEKPGDQGQPANINR